MHAGGAIIASGAIFGIVDAFVPAGYKAQAYALIPVLAYLTGVVMPPPKGEVK